MIAWVSGVLLAVVSCSGKDIIELPVTEKSLEKGEQVGRKGDVIAGFRR